jgi:cytochrome oxidase Cu insertion factor (SCO1/SenC/PrrC family)
MWGLLSIVSLCVAFGGFSMVHAESAPLPPHGLEALQQSAVMPSFNLPTTRGGTLDSATLKGKVVIVRFWATW